MGCMTQDALICARYWRNALADAELGRGGFKSRDVAEFVTVASADLRQGRVDPDTVAALFRGGRAEAESRTVLLRPVVYRARTLHGQRRSSLPEVLTPVVSRLTVFRDGRLGVPTNAVVPRDLLEPLDRNTFTIGTVEALDDFLTLSPAPGVVPEQEEDDGPSPASWEAYWRYCHRLQRAVFPQLAGDHRFEHAAEGLIEAREQLGAGRAIGALYDHIERDRPDAPLFETFASRQLTEPDPCLRAHAGFADRLGHSNPSYALAEAQRSALSHLLAAGHGEVVAVNGPPGTGKTTLLLSVVASLWAKAALDGGDPPIILACSTNNQAVTNIIDAFGADFAEGEGPFAGRWLPDLRSFGSYFPAASRKVPDGYLTRAFFDHVEDAVYVERARAVFLNAAAIAFPDLDDLRVETVVEALHGRLRAQAGALARIEAAWEALAAARERSRAILGDDPVGVRERRHEEAEAADAAARRVQEVKAAWDHHQASESLLLVLFGWLPAVARKRLAGARAALRPHWPESLPDWSHVRDIEAAIERIAADARSRVTACRASLAEADALLEAERTCLDRWCAGLRELGIDTAEAEGMTLAACDPIVDRQLRFPIFLTATHYWEGRWLLDMSSIDDLAAEKRRKGQAAVIPRWRRRMMLTPCAVSTFYVLPDLFRARRHDGEEFVDDYLYDTIDLLIVDEAGQVTPEVGAAAFVLARRALVIGDTAQIEPIWSVPGRMDTGNLLDAGLLTAEEERAGHNAFAESGRAASSGSVMRVAQHISRYHQEPDLARGLMLTEHRRCFDEIIGYCNDLCYRGKLQPLRGHKSGVSGTDGLPALGYLQVDGLCEQLPGGSRRNIAEAETIAAWIANRRAALEQSYPRRALAQIVGIVTPFAAQVEAIRNALNAAGIDAAPGRGVLVGSVHAFQGGQRPVMLFSPTYSKHADGEFIDRSTSMLNVAVSRAMNSFLVFGDMDCFSAAPRGSPRGQLAVRLFADAGNALVFGQAPRRDLVRRGRVEHLHDATEHDAFLRQVLEHCQREVQVVTPWLTQRALEDSGVVPMLSAAVARGIGLTVYTDRMLNKERARGDGGRDEVARARGMLLEIGVELIDVRDVHSKIVMADDDLFCAGSFNWFSAARDGLYARHETSLVYRGAAVAKEIEAMKASLLKRIQR